VRTLRNYYISKNKLRGEFSMGAAKVNSKQKNNKEAEAPLKGTWVSVTVVGLVIVATYVVLYGLYMARI
jgi:hypothetical protein